jgi:hypothetical protein
MTTRAVFGRLAAGCALGVAALGCSTSGAPKGPTVPTLGANASLAPGQRAQFVVNTHCGVEFLSLPLNGVFWHTDEAGPRDWIPAEWSAGRSTGEQLLTIEVQLSADQRTLTASKAGRAVLYRVAAPDGPAFVCA